MYLNGFGGIVSSTGKLILYRKAPKVFDNFWKKPDTLMSMNNNQIFQQQKIQIVKYCQVLTKSAQKDMTSHLIRMDFKHKTYLITLSRVNLAGTYLTILTWLIWVWQRTFDNLKLTNFGLAKHIWYGRNTFDNLEVANFGLAKSIWQSRTGKLGHSLSEITNRAVLVNASSDMNTFCKPNKNALKFWPI